LRLGNEKKSRRSEKQQRMKLIVAQRQAIINWRDDAALD
jgi:hypothetical protein